MSFHGNCEMLPPCIARGSGVDTAKLEFLRGTLDVLLLKALVWGPLHGYAITNFIRRQSDDALLLEEGTLYPALWRLESKALLAAEWGLSENNRKANYAPLNIDRRHTLVLNFVWQLPSTKLGVLADSVLHDWQLSGVFRAGSGPRYTVTYSIPGINARNLTGAEGMESARIVIVGNPGSGNSDDPYRQFNAAAFTIPSPGSIGLESGLKTAPTARPSPS